MNHDLTVSGPYPITLLPPLNSNSGLSQIQPVKQTLVGLSSDRARLDGSFAAIRQESDAILRGPSILQSVKKKADSGCGFFPGFASEVLVEFPLQVHW